MTPDAAAITNTTQAKKIDYSGWMGDDASLWDIDAELIALHNYHDVYRSLPAGRICRMNRQGILNSTEPWGRPGKALTSSVIAGSPRGQGRDGFKRSYLSTRAVERLVRCYASALKLDAGVTVHSLRVTALTTARERGADIIDLQDFAGHADPRTTLTYIRSRDRLSKSPAYVLNYWQWRKSAHTVWWGETSNGAYWGTGKRTGRKETGWT
jgi:hypothetical protein